MIKTMKEKGSTVVNPIYHWSDGDIWDYATKEGLKLNPMYKCGYQRVGCIGCPLASYHMRIKAFTDYPKYKGLYIRAFDRMIEKRRERNLEDKQSWNNGQEVFDWWIEEYKYNVKGQITIDEWMKGVIE